MFTSQSHKQGFTLVELLIVIAIIAILSAVVLGSMSVMRERGQAAKIIGDVRQVRDAIQFRYSEGTQYPTEAELEAAYPALVGQTKSITNLIDAGVFEGKFTAAPTANIGNGGYVYDADASDGATEYPIASCGSYTNNTYGVNLILEDAIETHPNVVVELDALVDSSDGLDCGRIRRATAADNALIYNISVRPTLFP